MTDNALQMVPQGLSRLSCLRSLRLSGNELFTPGTGSQGAGPALEMHSEKFAAVVADESMGPPSARRRLEAQRKAIVATNAETGQTKLKTVARTLGSVLGTLPALEEIWLDRNGLEPSLDVDSVHKILAKELPNVKAIILVSRGPSAT